MTDYDILEMSIAFLARQHIWLNEQSRAQLGGVEYTDGLFEYFLNELRLLRTYLQLYEKRSRIGIDEVFLPSVSFTAKGCLWGGRASQW